MTGFGHPIDMLDDAPEGDAVEQCQIANEGSVTGAATAEAVEPADLAEQRRTARG